jgi:hypothetical protein
MFVGCERTHGVRATGRTGGFNKVSGHDLVCERGLMTHETARPFAESRSYEGAAANSRNRLLKVSFYVLHSEKSARCFTRRM